MPFFLIAVLIALTGAPARLAGQDPDGRVVIDPAKVEALAPLLMAEDQRRYDSLLFATALQHQDAQIRRTAVTSLARIRDPRGLELLIPLLNDLDPTVVAQTFFGMGLLGDPAAVPAIITRLRLQDTLGTDAITEAANALARIGGEAAASFLADGISGRAGLPPVRLRAFRERALTEAWRLGDLAPIPELMAMASQSELGIRFAAIYSLSRLRAPDAGTIMLSAVRDRSVPIAEIALATLTKAYAEAAGLPEANVVAELQRGLTETRAASRINALKSLGTWQLPAMVSRIEPLLNDQTPNVQVQAALTLGQIGGSAAAKALDNALGRKNAGWALRRTALLALRDVDASLFARRAGPWLRGAAANDRANDPREKVTALEGYGGLPGSDKVIFQQALLDPRAEVIRAALAGWIASHPDAAEPVQAARDHLRHASPLVRREAVLVLGDHAMLSDLDGLLAVWQQGTAASSLEDRLVVIDALAALATREPALLAALSEPSRSTVLARPTESVLRRRAQEKWPTVLGQRWGAAAPVETGRSLNDYRDIVRHFVLNTDTTYQVELTTEARQTIRIELFATEAPLTVANFLQLVKRGYFDRTSWHRVVPNFVVQTGDPTGTGVGGSDRPIREEINRRRFEQSMLGMATEGSFTETGASQWFINLSPQPHLDGRYTVFGRVSNFGIIGRTLETAFSRIAEGDLILTIREVADS